MIPKIELCQLSMDLSHSGILSISVLVRKYYFHIKIDE